MNDSVKNEGVAGEQKATVSDTGFGLLSKLIKIGAIRSISIKESSEQGSVEIKDTIEDDTHIRTAHPVVTREDAKPKLKKGQKFGLRLVASNGQSVEGEKKVKKTPAGNKSVASKSASSAKDFSSFEAARIKNEENKKRLEAERIKKNKKLVHELNSKK